MSPLIVASSDEAIAMATSDAGSDIEPDTQYGDDRDAPWTDWPDEGPVVPEVPEVPEGDSSCTAASQPQRQLRYWPAGSRSPGSSDTRQRSRSPAPSRGRQAAPTPTPSQMMFMITQLQADVSTLKEQMAHVLWVNRCQQNVIEFLEAEAERVRRAHGP